jgi:diguanylate cyclase (GGDEF)-like protein
VEEVPAASSHRRALVALAAVLLAIVSVAFAVVGVPGPGIGHFVYIPVALAALATGPVIGGATGVTAAALYALGVLVNPDVPPDEVVSVGMAIRLVTYTGTGALIGWFARDNRRLLGELRILAERDSLTGLPNTRAFEAAIHRRLEGGEPFALLVGDMNPLKRADQDLAVDGNDVLLELAAALGKSLDPRDELARVGESEFAVLAAAASSADASRLVGRLERTLAVQGLGITFGWAIHPQEGRNALSLYRAADERLYARKMIAVPLRDRRGLSAVS